MIFLVSDDSRKDIYKIMIKNPWTYELSVQP